MSKLLTETVFRQAVDFDSTLKFGLTLLDKLSDKRVASVDYNRGTLFSNMADGKISVFNDYPSPLRSPALRNQQNQTEIVLDSYLQSGIKQNIRVKTGKAKSEKYFSVAELVKKWRRQRAILNITDFHFRDTHIEKTINPQRISRFNLYPGCPQQVADLEMMTLVMSSTGGFSDSHSDDSDGSNHCFVGKKLWLAWDTHEGLAEGLEDVDRVAVYSACRFDFETWLQLKSACWFIVESGQTLFMPGHLTHKVITLEPYLGVGSFNLSLPNCLRTLSRWLIHTPNWELLEPAGFREQVFPAVIGHLSNTLARLNNTSSENQKSWGLDYMRYAIKSWKNQYSSDQQDLMLNSRYFRSAEVSALRKFVLSA